MLPFDKDVIAGLGIVTAIVLVSLVWIAIHCFICYLLYQCYNRIPPEFRKQQPGLVWLLLIPCFVFVWNFFVYPQLSKSFKAYFNSINRADVGDCQESIGWAYSICSASFFIPYLNCLTGIASLVLLIIYLIKTNELKNQIAAV